MPALRYFASFPGTQLVWGKVHKSVFSSLQGAINMDKAGGGLMNDPCTSTSLCLDRRSPGGHLISLQSGLLQRLRSPNNRPHPFVRFPFLSFVHTSVHWDVCSRVTFCIEFTMSKSRLTPNYNLYNSRKKSTLIILGKTFTKTIVPVAIGRFNEGPRFSSLFYAPCKSQTFSAQASEW